jgi:hypothetical protein
VPFAHDPSPRLQSEARIWSHAALGPKHLRQCLEPTAGRLPRPTVFKLLAPIGDPAKEKIAADPWGLAAVEPPPLGFQFVAWAGGEGTLPCGKLNFVLCGRWPAPSPARARDESLGHGRLRLRRCDGRDVITTQAVSADV